ncbi:MAG: carbon-nitrogen family hydrolase [Deltaproteobacteria bacterium]|nr:carbon-nitrogen family hydrolase [Deltaproteobacteria bacterium]
MTRPFQASVVQFRIDMGNVDANTARAFALLGKAAASGAALCVLPEMWSTGFAYDRLVALSSTTPGMLKRLRAFASGHRMAIAGSLPERKGGSVYNTLYTIDRDGTIAGKYRKAHLFQPSGEHLHFLKGTGARVVETAVGSVGPLICYDLRFPELSRKYFLEGASLFCVSAQWPSIRKAHWDLLITARAVENQLFVLASNAVERSGDFRFAGGSMIVSPWGAQLAACGEEEGLATATIDPAEIEKVRRRIPCAQDRNVHAYRPTRQKK